MIDHPINDRKYRAWNKVLRTMEYDFNILKRASYLCDYQLMMSTFLLDANDKEIYEGDIIEHIPSGDKYYIKYGMYCSSDNKHSGVGFYFRGEDDVYRIYPDIVSRVCKVVANIKENPDDIKV